MKKVFVLAAIMAMVLGFSMQAHAALTNLGTDSLGNRLIYDTDLDITWYDYTSPQNNWQNQVDWADALTVDFGGNVYNDWRLPTTVDGPNITGWDGTTTSGWNITSSEMGHLFYTDLGNVGKYDTSGIETGCYPNCLTNTGPFQTLQTSSYWSGTEYSSLPGWAWIFTPYQGSQGTPNESLNYYAIAVRPGDVSVAVVPEPISSTLFLIGGATLGFRRFRKKFKK